MVFKCGISGCNTNASTKMHCLPKDPEIRRLWCTAIGRNDLLNFNDRRSRHAFRICDIHFAENDKFSANRNRTNLKYDAVPTLHLPVIAISCSKNSAVKLQAGDHDQKSELQLPEASVFIQVEPSTPSRSCISTNNATANAVTEDSAVELHADDQAEFSTPSTSGISANNATLLNVPLLKSVGSTRAVQLTPKARKLYSVANKLKRVARRLQYQNASNKQRLDEAVQFSESNEFLASKLNKRAFQFIDCQLKMLRKNARGRRFTFEDKLFALTLLKHGHKSYRLLRNTFALPSRKTLMNLLNKIVLSSGIHPKVLDCLKQSLSKLDILGKQCVLLFDEMSLDVSLTYDKKQDAVLGFQDIDGKRTRKFADHALVFMLRGIHKKWKQPVSFHFSQAGVSSDRLSILLKNTIVSLQKIGFSIVGTVCDQHTTNIKAIRNLKVSSRLASPELDIFEVGGHDIVVFYDTPHLLKGIRNNFIVHNVKFTIRNQQHTASWKDIVQLYELDEGDFNTRMCFKLTDAHVYSDKLKKMKVKHAAQIFSQRVSSTMRWTVKNGREGLLSKSAEGTAEFISFMDQVFDSVNGSAYEPDHGKELRCAVKKNSPHVQFWQEALGVFQSMKFITARGETTPPSVQNWIKTIHSFLFIWRRLQGIGFKYLCPRNINQDPIENFFGRIRSHGVRNINPSCSSFVCSFKTLIINNFASPHSPGANCEDDGDMVLNSLSSLLTSEDDALCKVMDNELDNIEAQDPELSNDLSTSVTATHSYIAGYIIKKIKSKVGDCSICRNQLETVQALEEHSFVIECEYRPHSLIRARKQVRRMFSQMVNLFLKNINCVILDNNLKGKLSTIFKKAIRNPFLCETHNIFGLYIDYFLNFFIFTYVKNINSILKGLTTYNVKDNDNLKKLAWQRFLLLKGRNRKIAILKRQLQE